MRTTAVTFALPAESSEFLRRLTEKSEICRNDITIDNGRIDDRPVQVFHTGVGERACRHRIKNFLDDQQFDALISAGFAGALTDENKVGDLLVAKNFSTIDASVARSARGGLPLHIGDLLTLPQIVDSAEERHEIARTSGAVAVDMETEFIARACAEHGVPLLSLRVITDTPHEIFPAPPGVLFDIERQRTNLLRLARFLFARPNRIPKLIGFARRVGRARKILANALVEIVREL